jgi:hypothetical protein
MAALHPRSLLEPLLSLPRGEANFLVDVFGRSIELTVANVALALEAVRTLRDGSTQRSQKNEGLAREHWWDLRRTLQHEVPLNENVSSRSGPSGQGSRDR